MKVSLSPRRPTAINCGIDIVVDEMYRRLPRQGIEFVPWGSKADLTAAHIMSPKGTCDVVHCHGLYPTGSRELEHWTWAVNADIVRNLHSARMVAVPSPWVAELFAREMGFLPAVVPHGIDIRDWPKHAPSETGPVIWNKNRPGDVCSPAPLETLAKAAMDTRFVGTFGTKSANLAITGKLPHDEMAALLKTGSIYFASTKETFGIGLLEALACGMPVLAWRWGSAPDIVEHKVNGYLANPNDPDDTLAGLRYCQEHYAELSAKTRARAKDFPWSKAMTLYASVYAEALRDKQDETLGLIEVVIPCYNYSSYIAQAIESVRLQTYTNWHCTIVNDGSTDDSLVVTRAATLGDARFTVIDQSNRGVATARNRGALSSRSPFIVFLDADDSLNPAALEIMHKNMVLDRSLGIVYGSLDLYDAEGKKVNTTPREWPGEFDMSLQMAHKNQVPSCCMLRRVAFERAGGYRQHTAPAEDAELWARIALVGYNVKRVATKALYNYRWHKGGASTSYRAGQETEPDWLAWIPAANGGPQPFASVASPGDQPSHPVREYDLPVCSIVIPVGDGHEELVGRAIETVTAQIDPRWELIVVDDTIDGDLPDQGEYPYRDRYPFIRWVKGGKHSAAHARNAGAAIARGEYLCFLDADDTLERSFLKETLRVSEECPASLLVYTDWFSQPDGVIHRAEDWDLSQLQHRALFAMTFVHPRQGWLDVGGFDESLVGWEDWDYTIKLGFAGYTGSRVKQPLLTYYYDTGTLRKESLSNKDHLLPIIRGKYDKVNPMPRRSCGCSKKRAPAAQAVQEPVREARRVQALNSRSPIPMTAGKPIPPAPGFVLLAFLPAVPARLFKTPSGGAYRWGGSKQTQWVNTEDATFFLKHPEFKELERS